MARLRANLRKRNSGTADEAQSAVLECGEIRIDFGSRKCQVRGRAVDLTPKEFEILGLLMKHEGKVLTHKFVLENVWGPANTEDREYVRVFIKQIREKVESDPTNPEYILTETGVGYRLTNPDDGGT
jgi:two-component system KDP operon response regulator KdpE